MRNAFASALLALCLLVAPTLQSRTVAAETKKPARKRKHHLPGPLPRWLRPVMWRACRAAHVPHSWITSRGLYEILYHESRFSPHAKNPTSTAYGLFQFLDSTWNDVGGHKTSDPYLQCVYGLRYIHERYGNPDAAWSFWAAHNWY